MRILAQCLLTAILTILVLPQSFAQSRLLRAGAEVQVKEIASWDPEFKNSSAIIGKKAVVTKDLLRVGADHWAGTISIAGKEYKLLDMMIDIISDNKPAVQTEVKDVARLQAGIRELVRLSVQDFSSIKTETVKTLPYSYGPSFLSSYDLAGAVDSSTIIYYDELVKRWHLRTVIKEELYGMQELDRMINTMDLPCGRLEARPGNDEFTPTANMISRYYVPADRMKPGNKYRYLTISIGGQMHKGEDVFIELRIYNRSFETALLSEQAPIKEPEIAKNLKKMQADIVAMVEAFKTEFSALRTGEPYIDQNFGKSQKINYQLEGSDPGDGLVFFDTTTKHWNLNIPISTARYKSDELDKIMLTTTFPFGKLVKEPQIEGSSSRSYIPADRAKLTGAYKDIRVDVLSYELNGKEIMLALLIQKNPF